MPTLSSENKLWVNGFGENNFCKMKIAAQKIHCDYTVSLGNACKPAHYLRLFRLRLRLLGVGLRLAGVVRGQL